MLALNKKSIKIAIGVFLFLGIVAVFDYLTPAEVEWIPTISKTDAQPYGAKATLERLSDIFDKRPEVSQKALYIVNKNTTVNHSLILGDIYLRLSKTDVESVLEFVERGNQAMLLSEGFPDELTDTLNIEYKAEYLKDTVQTRSLLLKVNGKLTKFNNVKRGNDIYFKLPTGCKYEVLGYDSNHRPNFIAIPRGKGMLYLHTDPVAISNFNLLYGNNAYISTLFSYLKKSSSIIWDEHYKSMVPHNDSSLIYIVANPSLRASYYLLLAIGIIYVFAFGRRRQRAIPIIKAPRNISLDFIKTISRLYFFERNNKDIATKKITYFFDRIYSSTGHRFTAVADEARRNLLSEILSCPVESIDELYALIALINSQYQVADKTLLELDKIMSKIQKKV